MVEYGRGPAGHPYHRFGQGDQPLVLIPGVTDSLGWNQPSRLTATLLARYYFPAFRAYDTWVVSRPPGLPAGHAVTEMAAGYGEVLEELGGAHVLGFSLGGFVATHLASTHPDLVDRLVLAVSGPRLGETGRQTVRRWRRYARAGAWQSLHCDYADTIYDGRRGRIMRALYRLGGPLLPTPAVPGDVQLSCDAALQYDGREQLESVTVPSLVIGGSRDELFPDHLQRNAARRLPDGVLAMLDGGHAVYDERRRQFNRTVVRFLRGDY